MFYLAVAAMTLAYISGAGLTAFAIKLYNADLAKGIPRWLSIPGVVVWPLTAVVAALFFIGVSIAALTDLI